MDNIFTGLKVIDFSSFIAGPATATILGDYGADVIKVEPPYGDTWRHIHQVPPQPASDIDYPWQLDNRNKRGVMLDLKSPSVAPIVRKLIEWADVVVMNTPHTARKKLNLEYEDVSGFNPRLIYADLTGFGEKGPDSGLPGFDLTAFWSRSGLLSATEDADAPPPWPVAGSGDHATSLCLVAAVCMALYHRQTTGKGAYVTTSLLAMGAWSAGLPLAGALVNAKFYPPHDRLKPTNAGFNPYKTKDGSWILMVIDPKKFDGLGRRLIRSRTRCVYR